MAPKFAVSTLNTALAGTGESDEEAPPATALSEPSRDKVVAGKPNNDASPSGKAATLDGEVDRPAFQWPRFNWFRRILFSEIDSLAYFGYNTRLDLKVSD
jgi:hypothetical protein